MSQPHSQLQHQNPKTNAYNFKVLPCVLKTILPESVFRFLVGYTSKKHSSQWRSQKSAPFLRENTSAVYFLRTVLVDL